MRDESEFGHSKAGSEPIIPGLISMEISTVDFVSNTNSGKGIESQMKKFFSFYILITHIWQTILLARN